MHVSTHPHFLTTAEAVVIKEKHLQAQPFLTFFKLLSPEWAKGRLRQMEKNLITLACHRH